MAQPERDLRQSRVSEEPLIRSAPTGESVGRGPSSPRGEGSSSFCAAMAAPFRARARAGNYFSLSTGRGWLAPRAFTSGRETGEGSLPGHFQSSAENHRGAECGMRPCRQIAAVSVPFPTGANRRQLATAIQIGSGWW